MLKTLLKDPFSWKFLLTLIAGLMLGANQLVDPTIVNERWGDGQLEHGHGVKAAVYAVLAALLLFISLINLGVRAREPGAGSAPVKSEGEEEVEGSGNTSEKAKFVNFLPLMFGALAAFGAGWHWLLDETKMNPGPYLYVVAAVGGLMLAALVVSALFGFLRERLGQRPG